MADNIQATQGTGTVLATDLIDDVHHPRVKIEIGTDGTAADVSEENPLPISANVLPLPSGAATATLQESGITLLESIDFKLTTPTETVVAGVSTAENQDTTNFKLSEIDTRLSNPLTVEGTVSVTGVSTAANQTTANASLASIDGKLSSPLTVTGTVAVTGVATAANQVTAQASLASIDAGIPTGLGQNTMVNSMPVVLASNHSTIVTNPIASSFVSYNTAQTGTVIKSGAGRLMNVILTQRGGNADTLQLWDNTAASGTLIADIGLNGQAVTGATMQFNCAFNTGLTITSVGGTSHWTITYQ